MPKENLYQSNFATQIEGYIKEKRAVGYKFQTGAKVLKRFDSFAHSNYPTETILTKQLVMEWTARKPNETISTQCGRISLIRGLAEFMNRMGYPAFVYPRAMVTVNRYAYIPYIFSNDEIRKILSQESAYSLINDGLLTGLAFCWGFCLTKFLLSLTMSCCFILFRFFFSISKCINSAILVSFTEIKLSKTSGYTNFLSPCEKLTTR
jgi:hypothetical protein